MKLFHTLKHATLHFLQKWLYLRKGWSLMEKTPALRPKDENGRNSSAERGGWLFPSRQFFYFKNQQSGKISTNKMWMQPNVGRGEVQEEHIPDQQWS